MATNQRGRNNNNPEGRNQHSGFMAGARDKPMTTAAAAAAAVGAGVFLWSRRNQISDQLSHLSDQVGEWSSKMREGRETREFEMAGGSELASASSGTTGARSYKGGKAGTSTTSKRSKPAIGMSETGGGNASLGAHSGGGGMNTPSSGRGRA